MFGASTANYIVWKDQNFNSANSYYKIGGAEISGGAGFVFDNLISGHTSLELDNNDNAIVYGTIKSGGVQVPVLPTPQRFSPTTSGFTIAASSTADIVVFSTPSGTLATCPVTLPTGGFDGQHLHYLTSQTITSQTFTGATSAVAITTLAAKTGVILTWDATASTWRQD